MTPRNVQQVGDGYMRLDSEAGENQLWFRITLRKAAVCAATGAALAPRTQAYRPACDKFGNFASRIGAHVLDGPK